MCEFRMKEIRRNLDGPPKGGKKELRDVLVFSRRKVAQKKITNPTLLKYQWWRVSEGQSVSYLSLCNPDSCVHGIYI